MRKKPGILRLALATTLIVLVSGLSGCYVIGAHGGLYYEYDGYYRPHRPHVVVPARPYYHGYSRPHRDYDRPHSNRPPPRRSQSTGRHYRHYD